MEVRDVLRTKREGRALTEEQIGRFLGGYVAGDVPDYQASALLMAIFLQGMEDEELFLWTRAMLRSGEVLDFGDLDRPKVDKHSTGGVGDKASLPLAPAVAACGLAVPMVSGRGLGHTAGTLDKLEAIPGFSTDLAAERLPVLLKKHGLFFAGQTRELVPADKQLYALRDATGLVESVPLIASSIMSKKLAEGLDALVLDVKFGSGAFLTDPARGEELARTMLAIAKRFELRASVLVTSMEQPLGRAVGHTLEVRESLECLAGEGPPDLRELVVELGAEILVSAQITADAETGRERISRALSDGSALDRFERIVAAQGGDVACVRAPEKLPAAPGEYVMKAEADGVLRFDDCRAVGLALCALGGGRERADDTIDPAVGIVFERRAGEALITGDVIARVHHREGHGLDPALALLRGGLSLAERYTPPPLVRGRLGA